jgi:hypothetical protein
MPEIESSEPVSNLIPIPVLNLTTKIQIKPMGFDSMLKLLFIIELEN